MNKFYGCLTLLTLFCSALYGQQEVVWKGQEVTTIKAVFCDTFGVETDSVSWLITIQHDKAGRDSVATRLMADETDQVVRSFYNEHGDLVKRIHKIENDSLLEFSWKYRYDETGRVLEETALDYKGELISQTVQVFNEKGELTSSANLVKANNEFTIWTRYHHTDGYKLEDPRYYPDANSYYYCNWKERRFYETPLAYVIRPSEDVFQRYTYQYTKEGRLLRTRLFDKRRTELEINRYLFNAELKLRSMKSVQPQRDSLVIAWDYRYDHQGQHYESNIFTEETGKLKRYDFEYEYKNGKLYKAIQHHVGAAYVHSYYGKFEELLNKYTTSMFGEKIIEFHFGGDGRINKSTLFRARGVPYEQMYYFYE